MQQKQWLPWFILVFLSLGLAMSYIDQTGLAIALPHIQKSLQAKLYQINLVPNIYWLAICVFCLIAGKLGDIFPKKTVLITGLVIFMLASLGCAFANHVVTLIIASAFLGIGAALMLPLINALLPEIFPTQKLGKAMGFYVGMSSAACIIGPLLVGFLIFHLSWRWLYFINVPIALLCIGVVSTLIKAQFPSERPNIDYRGMVYFASALLCTSIALSQWTLWGLFSYTELSIVLAAMTFIILLIKHLTQSKLRFLDPKLFTNRIFNSHLAIMMLTKTAITISIFMLPYFFQILHGVNSLQAGLLLTPMFITSVITAPIAGIAKDRFGEKYPLYIGLILSCCAWGILLTESTSNHWLLTLAIAVLGLSNSCVIPINISSALISTQKSIHGIASGVAGLSRQIGGLIGMLAITSVTSMLVAPHTRGHTSTSAFHTAWIIGGSLCIALYFIAVFITFRLNFYTQKTNLPQGIKTNG